MISSVPGVDELAIEGGLIAVKLKQKRRIY